MEKQDIQILEALFHGNHLNDSELERAKQLVFIIQSSFESRNKTKPKVWQCGHTENQHSFADTMFCLRDPNWYEEYKKENGIKDRTEISKDDFELYEDIRQEGITNMMDVSAVCSLSGLTREKVFKIMNNYEELRDKFS